MKDSILIFFIVLISSSCVQNGKITNEKSTEQTIIDSVKNIEVGQSPISETIVDTVLARVVDTTEDSMHDEFQDTPPVSIIGSWDDVDPDDPGPGSQSFTLEANGECYINEQEGGYNGTWSYDPACGILKLRLSHFNGSGEVGAEFENDYKIEEMTENRIEIGDLSDRYPHLGGSFWKN